MEVLVRDIADAWLTRNAFAASEANRIGYVLWAGAAGDVEYERGADDAHVWAALADMRFTRTLPEPDDAGETVVPVAELDALRGAFVRASNPFDHRKALHNVGLLTDVEEIDGDYPTVGLDERVTLDDDEAEKLGLTPRDELPGPSGGERVESLDGAARSSVFAERFRSDDSTGTASPGDGDEAPMPERPDAYLQWHEETEAGVLWFVNPKTGAYAAIPVTTGDSRDEDDGAGGRRIVWHIDVDADTSRASTSPSVHALGDFHTRNPQEWQLVESLPARPAEPVGGERVSDTTHGMGDSTAPGPPDVGRRRGRIEHDRDTPPA